MNFGLLKPFLTFASYVWNEVEVRLFVIKSLSQGTRDLLVCALEDGVLMTPSSSTSSRVVIAIRDAGSQGFEMASCCRKEVPAFGPPFFQQAVK